MLAQLVVGGHNRNDLGLLQEKANYTCILRCCKDIHHVRCGRKVYWGKFKMWAQGVLGKVLPHRNLDSVVPKYPCNIYAQSRVMFSLTTPLPELNLLSVSKR